MSDLDRDPSCMSRLKAGDLNALEELYDRHTPLLYSMVMRIVGRSADAEEVLQDTWLQVWRRADAYDPSRGAVGAWLLTLARSRAIDRLRGRGSRQRAERAAEVDPPVPAEEASAPVVQRQLHERVTTALAELSPQHREVLELAYFGGLSQSEIASRLGSPLGTVKSWTRQALTRLRALVPQEDWT
jgi:RNA polymerase sigma-70 factor (ECF subfamily)